MAYQIYNSRGTLIAQIDSGQENTTATSLSLFGANYPQYGEAQNENFVYLLENFANSSAPAHPVTGQFWYNTSLGVLNQYDINLAWVPLATQDYVQVQKNSPTFTGTPTTPTPANSSNNTQIASTAFVKNILSSSNFAPINSPAFTGVPTADTAANGTNTTQIATTAFVSNLVNDTTLSIYATKNNAVLTGVPVTPTAANTVANTQLATTAFVSNFVNDTTLSIYATKNNAVLTGAPVAPTAAIDVANTQIATTAFVSNLFSGINLSPYAPKASPTFTGIPLAPTALAATNTDQIATTNFVQLQKTSPAFTGVPTAPTAASGTNTTQIATTAFVTAATAGFASAQSVDELAGSIKMWGSSTPPNNWALCNGQAVSRTTYATLFSRIGTTYGSGDGSTTFNLPNFVDRFAVGAGTAYAAGSTGGYADAAVITHTHPVSSSVSINDSGHNHNNVLQATSDNVQRRVNLNRAVGASGTDAIGSNLGRNTDNATTGISASVNVSISAPTGAVSGTGRNLPPYISAYWIIKISDDGSGGGTLQAGAGIDITSSGLYSTITNTGVKSLAAGTGISISGSAGNLTVTNTSSLPTLTAGQGISIAQNGTTFTITNTVAAIPVVAGTGTTVTNTAGGAIVNANVANLQGGTGITVSNNGGTWTINAPGSGSASLGSSGWQEFPSGLIMQWGTDTNTGTLHTVTFPRPFPNACWSVTVSGVANGTYFIPYDLNLTTTGYQQGFRNNTGGGGAATTWTGHYIALGN